MNALAIRRASLWGAIAGTAVLAPFALQVVSHRWPQIGLAKFLAFTYGGQSS